LPARARCGKIHFEVVKRVTRTVLPQLRLTRDATVALPLQLARQLRAAIRAGGLPVGTRLPATRGFAAALNVSRNTVLTAYAELAADGLLVGRVGDGSYVAGNRRRIEFEDSEGNRLSLTAIR
jgi:DNA-binding GntR family transcriptional regulator